MYGVKFRSVIAAAGYRQRRAGVGVRRRSGDPGPDAARARRARPRSRCRRRRSCRRPAAPSLNTRNPTLVLRPALGTYASPSVSYEVQVLTTGGDTVYSRTIAGGPANGQGTLSHLVDSPLNVRTSYRWRARAVAGSATGPWSDGASGAVMFVTNSLTPGSSNDEFRDFFFSLTVAEEPDLPVAGGLSGDGCRPGCGRHHHREGLVGVHPWAHLPADRRR